MMEINDPAIKPYHIVKDEYCYTIAESITPQEAYTENSKPYLKYLKHYSTLRSCLEGLASLLVEQKEKYDTILEYIESYNQMEVKLNEILNKIKI